MCEPLTNDDLNAIEARHQDVPRLLEEIHRLKVALEQAGRREDEWAGALSELTEALMLDWPAVPKRAKEVMQSGRADALFARRVGPCSLRSQQ